MNKYLSRNTFFLLLILLVSVPAVLPLFKEGFFPVHDNTQVQRVFEMGKSLGDGMFPVRWVKDLGYGYGYPIFNFYAPLAYYFGGLLVLLSLNALLATKLMFLFGILFSGASMFLLAKEFWGRWGGLISAVFYVYAPYHALNIYVRGAVGEFWAYSFIPLVFLSIYLVYKKRNWAYVILGSLSFTAVIISHNLTAFMLTPFMILITLPFLWKLYKDKDLGVALKLISIFVLGIMLASFYWLPALLELKYTDVSSIVGSGSDFRNHFICINQLWTSIWGFGGSNPGCIDGISFRIGKLHLLAVVLALPMLITISRKNRNVLILSLMGFALSIFLTLGISRSVWELVRPMEFLQFPWRFLALGAFFSSLLAGALIFYIEKVSKDKRLPLLSVIFIVVGALFLYAKLFVPQKYIDSSPQSYTSNKTIVWDTSKISDEYMPKDFIVPVSLNGIPNSLTEANQSEVKVVLNKTQEKKLVISSPAKTEVVLNLAYFPAWAAFVDGKFTPVTSVNGKVAVTLPRGSHTLRLEFIETPIEGMSNLISIIGIVMAIAVIILGIKKKFKYEKKS